MTHRRGFLAAATGSLAAAIPARAQVARAPGTGVSLALNLYSFNQPLRDGSMTVAGVIDYCAAHGFRALDATAYYFTGYPQVPPDDYLFGLKRRAFVNGIWISGTGVRNDFAVADAARRKNDVQLVKNWITAAQKLGASVVRVFSGSRVPDAAAFERALEWVVPALRECAEFGREHGVLVGLQNHDDFLRTADETIRVVKAVNSEWLGVILDVGSLRRGDPYAEIEKLLPHAVNWQLKESVWFGQREAPIDLVRIRKLIEAAGYRGTLPIETLGEGDPKVKVAHFSEEVKKIFSAA